MSALIHRSYRVWLYLNYLVARRPAYKPIYRAEVVGKDILTQAAFLREAGYYMASAMLLRVYLESVVRRLALISPQWKDSPRHKFADRVLYLLGSNIIDEHLASKLRGVYGQLSLVAHGRQIGAKASWDAMNCVRNVRDLLNERFRLVLALQR